MSEEFQHDKNLSLDQTQCKRKRIRQLKLKWLVYSKRTHKCLGMNDFGQ